jgi:hypothetical protein
MQPKSRTLGGTIGEVPDVMDVMCNIEISIGSSPTRDLGFAASKLRMPLLSSSDQPPAAGSCCNVILRRTRLRRRAEEALPLETTGGATTPF